jgi:hypothetical protein
LATPLVPVESALFSLPEFSAFDLEQAVAKSKKTQRIKIDQFEVFIFF